MPRISPFRPQSLYPAKPSLEDAVAFIQAQMPVDDPNKMLALLMIYHNTLLYSQQRAQSVTRTIH